MGRNLVSPMRVNGGFAPSRKANGEDETAEYDRNKGQARRAEPNTKRETTLRTIETTATGTTERNAEREPTKRATAANAERPEPKAT